MPRLASIAPLFVAASLSLGCATAASSTTSPRPAAARTAPRPVTGASTGGSVTGRVSTATPETPPPGGWAAWAREHGGLKKGRAPSVGQVAMFGDAPGRPRWAGRVERVDADGTVLVKMALAGAPVRLRMNLQHPSTRRNPTTHRVYNHYLEDGRTTAQLWLGCVTPTPSGALVADAR